MIVMFFIFFFFFQAEDGIRDKLVTGVQTCALPIYQALEIERLLLHHLPPAEYESRRVLCGNAAQFQGDERDVMFLSVVDSAEENQLRLRSEPMFKQRFNVAASRARDQMWVVHSLDPADLN